MTALSHYGNGHTDQPGRDGDTATTEADARAIGSVRTEYAPDPDGDPDPGEIVWTWVPYEENDGRGKDRPVLVVAREAGGRTLLAVQLSSKRHDHDREWVPIGTGPWDSAGRESGRTSTGCCGCTSPGCGARPARWTGDASGWSSTGCASATAGRKARARGGTAAAEPSPSRPAPSRLQAPKPAKARSKASRVSGLRSSTPNTTRSNTPENGPASSPRKASATSAGSFWNTPQPHAPSTSRR